MWKLIDKVRQKSDSQKKRLAFSISLGTTLVIFTVWLTVIIATPDKIFTANQEKREDIFSPLNNIKAATAETFGNIRKDIGLVSKNLKGSLGAGSTSTSTDVSASSQQERDNEVQQSGSNAPTTSTTTSDYSTNSTRPPKTEVSSEKTSTTSEPTFYPVEYSIEE